MVEHGINYSMEHQAWLCVWQIGQQEMQRPTRLQNLATIHPVHENTLRIIQLAMLNAQGVFQNAASENIDLDADQVYGSLIWKVSPQVLLSAVIGQ